MLTWPALILGLTGSFHCLGMCGPIALAIPFNESGRKRHSAIVLYNLGRIITYSILGLLFGLFGKGVALMGMQQYLSVGLGLVILLGIVTPFAFKRLVQKSDKLFLLVGKLKQLFGQLFKKKTFATTFLLGLLNGLLPCGLVYLAIAGAISTGSWWGGVTFMTLFGLGTAPMMFALPYAGLHLGPRLKKRFKQLMIPGVVLFGVLLILRGANLGIPYVSPASISNTEAACCHAPVDH